MSPDLAAETLPDAFIPELPGHYRGKVRENYDLADGRRIIVATDRISAFDRILASIPWKGQVLTRIARHWFDATADICPNHVLDYPDPAVVVAKRLTILPVEIVVRGYLAGTTGTSILTLYGQGRRDMYGLRFPDGMRPNERLPEPIITPTSKAFDGGHDEPLAPETILAGRLLTEAPIRAATGSREPIRNASRPARGPTASTRITCGAGSRRAATPIATRSRRSRAR